MLCCYIYGICVNWLRQQLWFYDPPTEHDGRQLTLCLYWLRFLLQENSSFSTLRTAGVLCECLTNIGHLVFTVRCIQVRFDGSGLKTLPSGTFSSQLLLRRETKVSTRMLVRFFICFLKATGERTSNPLICKYALFALLCSPFFFFA